MQRARRGSAHLANAPGCTINTCNLHSAATWHLSLADANFAAAQTKDCYWVRMQNVQLAVATTLVGGNLVLSGIPQRFPGQPQSCCTFEVALLIST